ncbi:MAG: DUF4221 family protein [Bacteroidota bacterium]
MSIKLFFTYIIFTLGVTSCTNVVQIENEEKGNLQPVLKLEIGQEKKIKIDSYTAPEPQYTQIFLDSIGVSHFTFLNRHDNSIYFYNYETLKFEEKIKYERQGSNGIRKTDGYYLKNIDSIYVYNQSLNELVLTDHRGIIQNKISLRGKEDSKTWFEYYPQYYPRTVTPIIEAGGKLLFTGYYHKSFSESVLENFKFNAQIDLKSNDVVFRHTYPKELYGGGSNWEGALFTEVYPELHPDGDKIIYSFPPSHDLYITGINSDQYEKVYAGSNLASTISSINRSPKNSSQEVIMDHLVKNDFYAAIKYDQFRKVYYRVLLQGIRDATKNSKWKDKPIDVIIMDQDFNYLGETVIGNMHDWNWENTFVTKEGLNIEYIEKNTDEVYLTLKIFTLKNI